MRTDVPEDHRDMITCKSQSFLYQQLLGVGFCQLLEGRTSLLVPQEPPRTMHFSETLFYGLHWVKDIKSEKGLPKDLDWKILLVPSQWGALPQKGWVWNLSTALRLRKRIGFSKPSIVTISHIKIFFIHFSFCVTMDWVSGHTLGKVSITQPPLQGKV